MNVLLVMKSKRTYGFRIYTPLRGSYATGGRNRFPMSTIFDVSAGLACSGSTSAPKYHVLFIWDNKHAVIETKDERCTRAVPSSFDEKKCRVQGAT